MDLHAFFSITVSIPTLSTLSILTTHFSPLLHHCLIFAVIPIFEATLSLLWF